MGGTRVERVRLVAVNVHTVDFTLGILQSVGASQWRPLGV